MESFFIALVQPEILTILVSLIVSIGGGIRWLFTRFMKSQAALQKRHDELVLELKQSLENRIGDLEKRNEELSRRLGQYIEHVGTLKGIMRASGISHIPDLRIRHV